MAKDAIERATLYLGTGRAYRRIEARHFSHQIGRYDQVAQAIQLSYVGKGCRKPTNEVLLRGKLVVISGWGHPVPQADWTQGKPIQTAWGEAKATMHQLRYPYGDVRWHMEFDAFLEDYIQRSKAHVLLDFRNYDFKAKEYREPFTRADLTPEMPVIVTGVIAGRIVPPDQWPTSRGEIPAQEFTNLAEAQKVFPDLNLNRSSKRFWGPLAEQHQQGIRARFDSLDVFERLSK